MTTYDLLVIGAGPAGYVAAIRGAQEGLSTAIVEGHKLGGECLNYGCIPSKAFIQAAHVYDQLELAAKMGIEIEGAKVNLPKLVGWKDSIVKSLTGGVGQLLKANGVTRLTGLASFDGIEGDLKKITIDSSLDSYDGTKTTKNEKQQVLAKNVIIATGSTSVELPFLKPDGRFVRNSLQALACEQIPQKLIVLGGGFIGLEIGTFFSKIGTDVTVVEAAAQLLSGTDPDCVAIVHRQLKERGVKILLGTKAAGALPRGGNAVELAIEDERGTKEKLAADWILLTVGRKPRTAGLNLESIGMAVNKRGFIEVDNRLQTSVPGVYAIGDVIGGPMLAHKASKEGLVAVECILEPTARMNALALPWAIFVDPEIAGVGHSVESAKAAGWDPIVGKCPFVANGRALTTGHAAGFVKLVADRKTDRLLGAHMVGPDVSNLVAEAALAIEMGATSADIARTIHAHPTLPETLMEAAESVHGKAIHFFERRRPAQEGMPAGAASH